MNPKPCDNNSDHDSNNMVNNIKESLSTSNQISYAVSTDKTISCPSQSGTTKCTEKCDNTVFSANVKNLNTSLYPWMKIQKSKSPRIRCFLKDLVVISLIDSGAEINVIDAITARNAGIEIIKTEEIAKAANHLPLDIIGQTAAPVTLKCPTEEGHQMLSLGILLVVNNLGVQCLIGEPGKQSNNIICLPK